MPEPQKSSMPWITAGASAASGVGGAIISNIGSRKRQKYAYEKNLEMWNLQNLYNAPKAQMDRYREAGLNPNLMYGQGSPGNATQLPKYQAAEYKMQLPDMLNMLSQYQATKTSAAQEGNITADTANKVVENTIKNLDAEIKEYDAQIAFLKNTWGRQTDPRTGKSKIATLEEEKMQMQYQKRLLILQGVEQATTFNKYMDVGQIMGIAGKGGQILNLILNALTKRKR